MTMHARTAVLLAVALQLAAVAAADSIWAKGRPRAQAIFTDDTARDVGDLLTVIISEQTKIENETNRKLDKSSSGSASTSGTLDLANMVSSVGKHIFDFPKLEASSSSSNKFEGKANFDTDRSVTDKITVVVEDVLPNGNLVILGTRTRNIAGDVQLIKISGLVRPSDVSSTNEVDSEKIADFNIVYGTAGQENNFANPGWLARALNMLNPF